MTALKIPADHPIRVMLVDDSVVVRGMIGSRLAKIPGMSVVASVANGAMALSQLRGREIDVVLLDIEMPVMDGMTALPLILAEFPHVIVIMASTLTRRNASISLEALRLGAADFIPKPEAGISSTEDFFRDLADKILTLGRRGSSAALPTPAPVIARPTPVISRPIKRNASPPEVIAIGSSTGGPPALSIVFSALKGITQPILLTQHMPPTFTAMLAEQLERAGGRPCAEAKDGEPIVNGRSYVAPGGKHMLVHTHHGAHCIRLTDDPQEHFCRPAVDPLFRSVAEAYGPNALAMILTGMGSDGALGCAAIAAAGGRFVVQDEASSVVWGMPGAAAKTGLAEAILPLNNIGPWVFNQARERTS